MANSDLYNPMNGVEQKWTEKYGVFRTGWVSGLASGLFGAVSYILLSNGSIFWGGVTAILSITNIYRGIFRGR